MSQQADVVLDLDLEDLPIDAVSGGPRPSLVAWVEENVI
jgi:hypothetical protein